MVMFVCIAGVCRAACSLAFPLVCERASSSTEVLPSDMKEIGFCPHHLHSLPPDFRFTPSAAAYCSHRHASSTSSSSTTTTTASPLSPTSSSPLAYYVGQRQRYKGSVRQEREKMTKSGPRVSLTTLSLPESISPGAVGGNFNSTTKIKLVPLPTLVAPPQTGYRGIRRVCVHANRYLPSTMEGQRHLVQGTTSQSYLHLPSIEVSRPRRRLVGQETALERVREFKSRSGVPPHRVKKPFFMSGHSARIMTTTVGVDDSLLKEAAGHARLRVQFAKNSDLFYGRGVTRGFSSPERRGGENGGALRQFEVRLGTGLEEDREEDEVKWAHSFEEERTESGSVIDDGKQNVFITETRTDII